MKIGVCSDSLEVVAIQVASLKKEYSQKRGYKIDYETLYEVRFKKPFEEEVIIEYCPLAKDSKNKKYDLMYVDLESAKTDTYKNEVYYATAQSKYDPTIYLFPRWV